MAMCSSAYTFHDDERQSMGLEIRQSEGTICVCIAARSRCCVASLFVAFCPQGSRKKFWLPNCECPSSDKFYAGSSFIVAVAVGAPVVPTRRPKRVVW
eukprot:scaffold9779_cov175-Amphora_coffeaeformis.AAC.3